MIYRQLFDRLAQGQTVRAGVIGVGDFATAIVTQGAAVPRLQVPIAADLDVAAARRGFLRAGCPEEDIVACDSRGAALAALERGKRVVVPDGMLLMDLPLDVIVESTGLAEAGARHAEAAIAHGKHVAMVTKETDVTVGPLLKHLADRAGLVYSAVDGDQHGLLMGLVDWARELGLEVLSGGKALDPEFVYDPAAATVTCEDKTVAVDAPCAALLAPIAPGQAGRVALERRERLRSLHCLTGSDLGEMAIAANATGLLPEVEGLYCPPLRPIEIPEFFAPEAQGGILRRRGAIDAVIDLRGPYEAGLGGGVWIVVACDSDYSRATLTGKGLLPNARGSALLIYRPHHLCGVETPMTLLCAALLKVPTGASDFRPRVDLVARAARDLPAGHRFGDWTGEDLHVTIAPAAPLAAAQGLPILLAHRNALRVGVPQGTIITADMVDAPPDSRLWALRAQQDRLFLAPA